MSWNVNCPAPGEIEVPVTTTYSSGSVTYVIVFNGTAHNWGLEWYDGTIQPGLCVLFKENVQVASLPLIPAPVSGTFEFVLCNGNMYLKKGAYFAVYSDNDFLGVTTVGGGVSGSGTTAAGQPILPVCNSSSSTSSSSSSSSSNSSSSVSQPLNEALIIGLVVAAIVVIVVIGATLGIVYGKKGTLKSKNKTPKETTSLISSSKMNSS